ncbi:MAG: DUF1727 domain-containing protein [Candidatus Caenarcaniphilales bacterium]|nr:DUF1727 domain-containing protein [Candidatus Caenarcaniphilales bacterium]
MQKKLAIFAANFSAKLIKFLKLGNASSLPGRIALKIYPELLKDYFESLDSSASSLRVAVSGTNGKTTSVGLLDSIYEVYASKENLISNRLGANLYYGIATAFILSMVDKHEKQDFILEVDEAALRSVVKDLKPDLMALTNIFRDQLDRFGEIDTTRRFIQEAIDEVQDVNLVINYDDPKIRSLKSSSGSKRYFYKLEISDELKNKIDYKVSDKDASLEELDLENDIDEMYLIKGFLKEVNSSGTVFDLKYAGKAIEINLNLPGIYNVYNALLAASVFIAYDCPLNLIKEGLEGYKGSFGRAQNKIINGKSSNIFLIKNPKGCSEVLNLIKLDEQAINLIIINDDYADGRDVSWLWDADFETLAEANKESENVDFICSGNRAYDMALRLKYAGISAKRIYVEEYIKTALDYASKTQTDRPLNILPTYTALLYLEKILSLTKSIKA